MDDMGVYAVDRGILGAKPFNAVELFSCLIVEAICG